MDDKGKKSITQTVLQFVLIIIVVGVISQVGLSINERIHDKTALVGDAYATGTYTFSGSVINGELVNITNGGTVYNFEFNTTAANGDLPACITAGCIIVDVTGGYNTPTLAAGRLVTAIQNNAGVFTLISAEAT